MQLRVNTLLIVLSAIAASNPSFAAVSEDSVKDWGYWKTVPSTAAGGVELRLNIGTELLNHTDSSKFTSQLPGSEDTLAPIPPGERFYGAMAETNADNITNKSAFAFYAGLHDYNDENRTLNTFTPNFLPSEEGHIPQSISGVFSATDENSRTFTSATMEGIQTDQILFAQHSSPETQLDKILAFNIQDAGLIYAIGRSSENGLANKFTVIQGISSSLQDIQRLAGITSASYSGTFLRSLSGSTVNLTVNFSDASWTGNFSQGDLSFSVENGTINGVDLNASVLNNQISSNSALSAGTIQASFFGSQAESIAGIADISLDQERRFVDTFITNKTADAR